VKLKKAWHFSVMADEVSSHNIEDLALCLRYVDESNEIQEKFVEFIKLPRVRAMDIATAITAAIEDLGLSLTNLRSQGHDGASNMSGHNSEVQKQIRDKQPKALYTSTLCWPFFKPNILFCSGSEKLHCSSQNHNLLA